MNVYAINICTNPTDENTSNKLAVNPYPMIVMGTDEELKKYITSPDMDNYIKKTLTTKDLYSNSVYRIKVVEDDYWMREFEWKIPSINKIVYDD